MTLIKGMVWPVVRFPRLARVPRGGNVEQYEPPPAAKAVIYAAIPAVMVLFVGAGAIIVRNEALLRVCALLLVLTITLGVFCVMMALLRTGSAIRGNSVGASPEGRADRLCKPIKEEADKAPPVTLDEYLGVIESPHATDEAFEADLLRHFPKFHQNA